MVNSGIKVSIVLNSFNQEKYIKEALEGIVAQKTDFNYEVLIHDDASTDRTVAIIKEYIEQYPQVNFKPIFQKENQYSQKIKISSTFQYPRAKGKYIALCEGDDYWTDPYKLQKQVDFMENHPDYSLIAGGYTSKNTVTGEEVTNVKVIKGETKGSLIGFDITLERQLENWLTKTLTVLFRKDFLLEYNKTKYQFGKDVHLYYHLLKRGKGYYMKEILGVYRVHEGGVFSLKSKDSKLVTAYNLSRELYQIHRDTYSRKLHAQSIRNIIKARLYKRNLEFKCLPLLLKLLSLIKTKEELKTFISLLYKK